MNTFAIQIKSTPWNEGTACHVWTLGCILKKKKIKPKNDFWWNESERWVSSVDLFWQYLFDLLWRKYVWKIFQKKAQTVFIDFRSGPQGLTLIMIGSIHVLEVLSIKMILSKWRLSKWRLPGLTDNEEKSIFKINYDISSIDKTMVWNVKQK